MEDLKINLYQIERAHLPNIQSFFNDGFEEFLPTYKQYSKGDLDAWLDSISSDHNTVGFTIQGSKGFRDYIVGLVLLRNIDWISRHAELFFVMVDKEGSKATMHDLPATKYVVRRVMKFAFEEFNLNKIWIEAYENNKIMPVLESFGFVAEGVRKEVVYKNGKYLDSVICSVLKEEYDSYNN